MANNRELSQLGSIVVVDDSSRNLGIGTTTPDAIVGAGNTAKLSVGILSAYQLYGDATNLTGLTPEQVGALANVVEDTTPQLGGDLDVNGNDITGTGNVNLTGGITATSFSGNGANLTAVDATTLDTFDSSQFLRSDVEDAKTSGNLLFSNNVKLRLGSGGDLNLYHNGGYSIIENDSSSSDLFIRALQEDKDVVVQSDDGSGGIATYFQADGSTGEAILYHYGTQKLATKSTGIDVTGHTETDTLTVSGKFETTGIGVSILNGTSDTATIAGPSNLIIDPGTVGDNTGIVRIKGDLFVDGTQTQINSTTIELADFVVGIATTATSDLLADGAGIEIGPDNTFKYHYNGGTNPSLKSSENLNVASGKAYQIDQVEVLNATTLGSNVVNSSLTSVGTLSSLTVSGNITANGNILGDSVTNISGINSITATSFHGDGSCLTNLPAAGFLADAQENLYAGTSAGASSDADTCFNIGIGYSAGASLNSGNENIFLGSYSGNSTTSGGNNVFLGRKAGANHTSGYYNVAIGQCANASGTTTGKYNVFVGCGAGDCVTSGCDNVYLGRGAGNDVTTGRCNIALGFFAGSKNQSGQHNIFFGNNAGGNSSSGNSNINIGQRTGFCNAGGCYNNFIGHYAGYYNTTGCSNNYFGYAAGYSNSTGSANNIFGENAGFDLASGSNNVFIGNYSGKLQTSGDCNIAIGHNACLPNKTGSSQLAIGAGSTNWIAGDSSFNVTIAGIATVTASTGVVQATKFCGDGSCLTGLDAAGFNPDAQENLYAGTSAGASSDADTCFNIGIGYSAGSALNSGDSNVFLGQHAGKNVTSGNYNIALGKQANCNRTGGNDNITLGRCSGTALHPSNSSCNIFIGAYASGAAGCQSNCAGCHNIGIGQCALHCAGRSDNIAIGRKAGGGLTSAGCNIAIGPLTLNNGPGGNCNIAIGCAAGKGANGINNVFLGHCTGYQSTWTYSENTIIGNCAGQNSYGSKNTFLGHLAGNTNTGGHRNVAIGYDVELPTASGSDQMAIGNCCGTWISGDSNFNVGIGTNTDAAVGAVNTAKLSVGIVSAYKLYGDGSCLTGINAGFDPDSQENLYAGTNAGAASDADTCFNIGIGYSAGSALNEGDHNVLLGSEAGKSLTSGKSNIFLGQYAGKLQSTGNYNIVFGRRAMCNTTYACANIVMGFDAGRQLNGSHNVAIGWEANWYGCGGGCNIILGKASGYQNCGTHNIFMGRYTGGRNTTGCYNVFLGHCAGDTNTTGGYNIALGCKVALPSATGSCQLAIGVGTDRWITGDSSFNVTLTGASYNATWNKSDNALIFADFANAKFGTGGDLSIYHNGSNSYISNDTGNLIIGSLQDDKDVIIQSDDGSGGSTTYFKADGSVGEAILTHYGTEKLATKSTGVTVTGSMCATTLYGDGSNLTGINAGFEPDDDKNLVAGTSAGASLDGTSGCFNIFLGECSGKSVTSGACNTFIGVYAGGSGTVTGNCNIAMGQCAANNLTSGNLNIAIGKEAGCCLTDDSHSIFIGWEAGRKITTSSQIAIGKKAGCANTGYQNIFLGNYAGCGGTTGSFNLFLGQQAASMNTGSDGIFIGCRAGYYNSGDSNIFMGACAGYDNTSGASNIFIGKVAGENATTGSCNVFIGRNVASNCAVTAVDNVIIGSEAGRKVTSGSYNVFMGQYAGCSNTTGCCNIYLGKETARDLSGGQHNVIAGWQAGYTGTTAGYNVVLGYLAYAKLCTGQNNVAVGPMSGYCNCGGNDNVYIGNRVGYYGESSSHNVFIGSQVACSGYMNQSCCNIAIGYKALFGLSLGDDNIVLGNQAGLSLTEGCRNIFLGQCAGNTNTTGHCNIAIGYDVELPSATSNRQFAIGEGTNRWIYGDSNFNIYDKDGNQLNGASSGGGGGGLWSQTSVGIHTLSSVGIGTTNPQSKLEINVGTAVSAFDIQGSAGQLFSVTNNLTSGSIFSVNDVSGIPSIDVDADGTIQLAPYSTTEFVGVGITNPTTKLHVVGEVTATDFNSTSDSRLKTNVQVIDDPLAKILQINGVSFNWIENNKPSMGVIADNIEEVVPELVSDTDPKTVNYNGLIGLLIEVVKEQQTQIDSLNERLSRLE